MGGGQEPVLAKDKPKPRRARECSTTTTTTGLGRTARASSTLRDEQLDLFAGNTQVADAKRADAVVSLSRVARTADACASLGIHFKLTTRSANFNVCCFMWVTPRPGSAHWRRHGLAGLSLARGFLGPPWIFGTESLGGECVLFCLLARSGCCLSARAVVGLKCAQSAKRRASCWFHADEQQEDTHKRSAPATRTRCCHGMLDAPFGGDYAVRLGRVSSKNVACHHAHARAKCSLACAQISQRHKLRAEQPF